MTCFILLCYDSNLLHIEQKSRNTSDYLTFIINPIETFEIVAPIKNGKRKISEVIRERIKIYNKLDFLPSTLSIGDPDSSDWMQFQHEEGTSKLPTKCPLIISGDIHD